MRPQWRNLLGSLRGLGGGGLAERAQRLRRAFEEEGVTSVLPGASASEQIWQCDPVPLPLAASEFEAIEVGLIQRAKLIEQVLGDLYGRQNLLSDGVLPPSLVYANPGFQRACHGLFSDSSLHFYAADVLRGPDGTWRVLADRTAGASGIGFARENRRMLTRVLPELQRSMQLRQLRPFFDFWQDSLHKLAAPGEHHAGFHGGPSVALLTPGTTSPLWFEHMYLARELSCALVEGGDLSVRGGLVYLKTLRGLQQVDVLLRRTDGKTVDPLELDHRSQIGVPGLLDAVRAGSVKIVNDPGAAMAEAPALAAFLPELCLRLLGEPLQMQSVPTLWLGHPQARRLVQQDPNRWLIRPATDGSVHALVPAQMQPEDRAILMRRIDQRPWEWAASEITPPSVTPCLQGDGLEPLPVVVRVYLVQDKGEWRAMQGGLARIVGPNQLAGSLPMGGLSKDVWVLNEERRDFAASAPMPAPALRIRRTTGDLPSRVADNLFWLGRHVERLERSARLIRAAISRLSRSATLAPREMVELQSIVRCLVEVGCVPADFGRVESTGAGLIEALVATTRDTGALMTQFQSISWLTESVRDRLTGDMYATFTQALRSARGDAQAVGRSLDKLAHAMVSIQRYSNAVAGVAAESMVRGGGWIFLELGRRMERAHAVTSEIAIAINQSPPRIEVGLKLALELCDSAITYRTRYMNVLQPAPVLDLVLADQGNPRGLAFQLVAIHALLDELAEPGSREMFAGVAAGLVAEVEALVESVLGAQDQALAASDLPPNLEQVAGTIADLSDRITRRYFALLPMARSFGGGEDDDIETVEPVEPLQGVA